MALHAGGKILLYAAPLSAVVVVLLGVLVGGERPIRSARVYGGPTEGEQQLNLRVELGRRDRVAELPIPDSSFTVAVLEGGRQIGSARGRSDRLGNAEIALRLPRAYDSAIELWVQASEPNAPSLARGLVLCRSEVVLNAPRRGGFQRGRHPGQIELAVAPAWGVLLTGHGAMTDELLVRAERGSLPVPGARVTVRLEGATPTETQVTTDERGGARVALRPNETSVRVMLEAVASGVGEGRLTARFDVVQGAIRARRAGQRLLLETTGAASTAWIALFDDRRRLGGMHVQLAQAPDGRLLGEAALPQTAPAAPLWAVVSSQADLGSPSAVGWPLHAGREPGATTLDVREQLLLDGAPAALAREVKRARRIRLVTAGYAAVALLLTLVVFVRRVKEADAGIERHLRRAGIEDAAAGVAPARGARTLLAAACIGLGFLVLALLALYNEY